MNVDMKSIHMGKIIRQKVAEQDISSHRICKFMQATDNEIDKMYQQESLDTEILLRWSKLLEYDFFRVYTHYLFISEPKKSMSDHLSGKQNSSLPQFRKTIYSKEVVEFVLELISTGKKSKTEIMREYGIPKSTVYQWIRKYENTDVNIM